GQTAVRGSVDIVRRCLEKLLRRVAATSRMQLVRSVVRWLLSVLTSFPPPLFGQPSRPQPGINLFVHRRHSGLISFPAEMLLPLVGSIRPECSDDARRLDRSSLLRAESNRHARAVFFA